MREMGTRQRWISPRTETDSYSSNVSKPLCLLSFLPKLQFWKKKFFVFLGILIVQSCPDCDEIQKSYQEGILIVGKRCREANEERGKKVGKIERKDGKPITAKIGSCGNRQRQREPSCFEMDS